MSGIAASGSALPTGYESVLTDALQRAIGRGQSITVTATAGSSDLTVSGSAASLFDTSSVGTGLGAAALSAQAANIASAKDTVSLSPAAQSFLNGDQIALYVINAAHASSAHAAGQKADTKAAPNKASGPDAPADPSAPLADPAAFYNSFTLASSAAWQASPAAVAEFRALLAQGQQASAADRFYANMTDPDFVWTQTNDMSDTEKASFMTAYTNHTLTITGMADMDGAMTGTLTTTLTAQGMADGGDGWMGPAPPAGTHRLLIDDGLFGWAKAIWTDPAAIGT